MHLIVRHIYCLSVHFNVQNKWLFWAIKWINIQTLDGARAIGAEPSHAACVYGLGQLSSGESPHVCPIASGLLCWCMRKWRNLKRRWRTPEEEVWGISVHFCIYNHFKSSVIWHLTYLTQIIYAVFFLILSAFILCHELSMQKSR